MIAKVFCDSSLPTMFMLQDLEMIKQREEEAGALGEVIRKVTHKGEIEIDSSEIGDKIIMEVCVYYAAVHTV